MPIPFPPLPPELQGDAPRSCRLDRYSGRDTGLPLESLRSEDSGAVVALYAKVESLAVQLAAGEPLHEALSRFDAIGVTDLARRLGNGGYEDERPRHALHDVRSGAVLALTFLATREARSPGSVRGETLRFLAADHAKVMRHLLLGLDDHRRAQDLVPKAHPLERLVQTFRGLSSEGAHFAVHVAHEGDVTSSCMEMGSLERVALNVANNALRHASASPAHAWFLPGQEDVFPDLRCVVTNALGNETVEKLRARFGDNLARLFHERFSTTGSGDGLHIVGDVVASAYGLAGAENAARERLVGARIVEGQFVAWFHWPAVTA